MKTTLLILTLLFFTACSTVGNTNLQSFNETDSLVIKKLLAHYQQWQGARYRLGGMSKNGVDCSGFVYIAFLKRFNLELPRTTINQIRAGQSIQKSELTPGDLVFFKTGVGKRHVGIYLERGRFMHASSSRGVMISNLNNSYWRKHYWMCKHIPELEEI